MLLVSTYELGHQPFGLAEPAAVLRRNGTTVKTLDLAVQRPTEEAFQDADLIAFYLPMHTATRLAAQVIPKVRSVNPEAHIAAYGLYAPMNEEYLRNIGVRTVIGGEFEQGLTDLAHRVEHGVHAFPGEQTEPRVSVAPQDFVIPDRRQMRPLQEYAYLELADGERRIVGYTEATHGCKHLCKHCPIVPVYKGRFRAVPREIVLADIRQQVSAGAEHITFGDPDFFNGPTHGIRIVEALHREFPKLTYDVTIKIKHLLAHAELLPVLNQTGCLFVTTAVESVQNHVLDILDKGHTRKDFHEVVEVCGMAELFLAPTFVPFTPWTTLDSYLDLLTVIGGLGLVNSVAPVQLTIRLLIPPGSCLLKLEMVREIVGPLDEAALIYPWSNSDPRVDDLHAQISSLVQRADGKRNEEIFSAIWQLAHDRAGRSARSAPIAKTRRVPAKLSEPWYCCAEPTDKQMAFL